MANKLRGAKIFHKWSGGGGARGRARGAGAQRCSSSDATSDEDYVVAEDEEQEEDGSSYFSDGSREDVNEDAESTSCAEKDEDDEEEWFDDVSVYEEAGAARGKRPRKRPAPSGSRRRPKAKPSRRRRSRIPRLLEEVEKTAEAPAARRSRTGSRRRPSIRDEGEEDEYEDVDDDEFVPDDGEGDGDEDYLASSRKAGGRKNGAVKRRRRRTRVSEEKVKKKKKTASMKKRRRRRAPNSDDEYFVMDDAVLMERASRSSKRSSSERKRKAKRAKRAKMAPISEDDDFVVEDGVLVERTRGKKRKKTSVSKGKKRRPRAILSDASDSDFDYTISEEELRVLQVGSPLGRQGRKALSPAVKGEEKGRGKEVDELGKQICGICLSEEQKGGIRGMLDCCAHYFCFACIMEWSKVESRCPLCKQRFKTVNQSARSDAGFSPRAVVKRIPKRDQVYQPSEEEIRNYQDPYAHVVCMECQQGGDDHLMLLCDICDSPAHTYCVGLGREVPEGSWYCDGCRSVDPGSSNQESMVEHGMRNRDLLQDIFGETASENATNCMPHECPQWSATLQSPRQSLSGVGQDALSGYHSSLGDRGTPLSAPGSVASTLSGRRSIHQHIRIMLSNNRIRRTPDGAARNAVTQPSRVVSDICSSEVDQPEGTLRC